MICSTPNVHDGYAVRHETSKSYVSRSRTGGRGTFKTSLFSAARSYSSHASDFMVVLCFLNAVIYNILDVLYWVLPPIPPPWNVVRRASTLVTGVNILFITNAT